jgi:HAMP domain-containing protein
VNPSDLDEKFGDLIQNTPEPAREFGELNQEFGELAQTPPTWPRKSVSWSKNSLNRLRK